MPTDLPEPVVPATKQVRHTAEIGNYGVCRQYHDPSAKVTGELERS